MTYPLRKAKEQDWAYIYNTWLRSYRNSDRSKHLASKVYFAAQSAEIEQHLKTAHTIIAYDPEDEDHILAYAVFANIFDNHPVTFAKEKGGEKIFAKSAVYLHYVFTRENFRKQGIASTILNIIAPTKETILIATHINNQALQDLSKHHIIITERAFENLVHNNFDKERNAKKERSVRPH
jgi:GNAT superfamily N-acetyltransferase